MPYQGYNKQSLNRYRKIIYVFPITFFCCLGFLIFYLIHQLNEFSNDIANYYNPMIHASRSMMDESISLQQSLQSHSLKELYSGHSNSLNAFHYAYKRFDTLTRDASVAERHLNLSMNKDLVSEGKNIFALLGKGNLSQALSALEQFVVEAQKHLGYHEQELERTRSKMKTLSQVALSISMLLLISGVVATLGIKKIQESIAREIETIAAMTALVNALEARDHYTKGHSVRVADLAVKVANKINLPRKLCQKIFLSALLHDIGKLGVPDKVLLKSGTLSVEELVCIQSHPELGRKILKDSGILKEIVAGVYHHHEKYNGSGYPDGLVGEDIPISAQCISIADAYDAMTSARPYREAMSQITALEEIERYSGTHWSHRIASSFLNIMRK